MNYRRPLPKKSHTKVAAIDASFVHRATVLSFLTLAIYLLLSGTSFAQNTPMGDVLCDIVDYIILGDLGRGLATLAVIMLGIGAMLGKVSWGLAITVCVGIAVTFGAKDITDDLGIPIAGVCP